MLARLHEDVAAVAPIHGVSGAQGSVVITYNGATGQQQTDANAVVATFDWSQAAHNLWLLRKTSSQIGRASAKRLGADRSTTLASFQDVVGLEFELEANRHYTFRFDGAYSTVGTTTALWLALSGPANSFFAAAIEIATSTTAWLSRIVGGYDVGPEPTAGGGTTLLPFHMQGNITTTASGLLIVRGRSETAGNQVTIKRGSQGILFAVE